MLPMHGTGFQGVHSMMQARGAVSASWVLQHLHFTQRLLLQVVTPSCTGGVARNSADMPKPY
jgi:hypothetical protein